VAQRVGLKPIFVKTATWSQSQVYLKEKRCDILPAAVKTKKREKYANFTRSHFVYNLAIITKNNKPLVNSLKEIADRQMSRTKGSGIVSVLRKKYPEIKIKETSDIAGSFSDVENGRSYFTIATLPVFAYYQKKYDIEDLQVAGYSSIQYKLRIAVRKDDDMLLKLLDNALEVIPQETLNVINNRWTLQEVIKVTDYSLVWKIVIVSFVIFLIILIAYLKQKKLKTEIIQLNASLEKSVKRELEKNRQQQILMFQQSRMAQMGEMINMVAHQWRQPLNNLSLVNQLLLRRYDSGIVDKKTLEYFKENSQKQIELMSTTIDDFRNFFKSEKEKKIFCINDIISKVLKLTKPIYSVSSISVCFNAEEKYFVAGYPNELGQAVLNIINNAKDALMGKDIGDKRISIHIARKREDICIEISDNAGGVPENIMDRIFDPYFSTKEEKNGTGLGLYMTKMIIEDHMKAVLGVRNDSEGAVFKICVKESRK
jgi:signal transduction histidine kinase